MPLTASSRGTITTILFTDLVNSTDLMRRLGDERAQPVFQAHHRLLEDALAATGGEELQWLGDGLMAAFASTADAVRGAIAMQQAAVPEIAGEQLQIRVGLNVGEILRQTTGSGYFGIPVVTARRLCDRAAAGQILCTSTVAGLLAGRQAFRFRDLGQWEVKGLPDSVGVAEVVYDAEGAGGGLARTPFVGRRHEIARLTQTLAQAKAGQGALVLLVGEPGIGKTRVLEELAAQARKDGVRVLWSRSYESEWAPPYGPFAEALAEHVGSADLDELREDLGASGGVLAKLVPRLRDRLPDLPEPPALQPDEERYRLLDAVAQFLLTLGKRSPVLLVLDDLHWADGGTVAMLRYLARFAPRGRVLLAGAYRDVELDRQHPLADALGALRREIDYERLVLRGLEHAEVGELLAAIAAREVPEALVDAIDAETEGNPFFIREVLLHLMESGKLHREGDRWTSRSPVAEMGIPEGVRQVIGRRLSRLSAETNRLLAAAAGFQGTFPFAVAFRAADLEERVALDALDAALDRQLLHSAGADTYDFTHALIRHTLYAELNPSRQVRLHRRIAEELERLYGERPAERAGEIARQYHRSAALPGAERGVPHCLAAAERAEATAAHEEVASYLRMALDLLPAADSRRPRLLARRGLALAWSLALEEAVEAASEAGSLLAGSEGSDAAGKYLADATDAVWMAEFSPRAWQLAEEGLRHIGARRDLTWARLATHRLHAGQAADPGFPGIPIDTPEQRELARVVFARWDDFLALVATGSAGGLGLSLNLVFSSREEVLARAGPLFVLAVWWAGEMKNNLPLMREAFDAALPRGQLALAAFTLATVARVESALGNLTACETAFARTTELASRVQTSRFLHAQIQAVPFDLALVRGEGFELLVPVIDQIREPENRWIAAVVSTFAASVAAHLGQTEDALRALAAALPAIERAPGWAVNYTYMIHLAVHALWVLGRTDHAAVIERNLREKTVTPDFRYPHTDGRLSLARLCALQGRADEAADWFAKARAVLDKQGARPLRALTDFDEAWMYGRRGAPGDRERALPLLDAAVRQFREIGMAGWLRRAEELRRTLLG